MKLLKKSSGFTAIELLVVVAIVAVLAAFAAPSFNGLMESWRVRSAAEDLQSTLYLARSESIRNAGDVSITKKSNVNGCSNATNKYEWGCGWSVTSSSGTVLQQTSALNRVAIEITDHSGSGTTLGETINVNRWGQLSNSGRTTLVFRLWPEGASNSSPAALSLCLQPSGQIKRLNTGNGACS